MDPLGTAADEVLTVSNANTAGGLHEIIERPVPTSLTEPNPVGSTPASPQGTIADPPALASRRTYNYAGLRIFVNRRAVAPTPTVRVFKADTSDPNWDSNGSTPRSVEIPRAANGQPPTLADRISDAITTSAKSAVPNGTGGSSGTGDFYDYRELREVNVNNVDVSKLKPVLNGAGTDYNGVIYISDITNADSTTGASSNVDAIRLRKGAELPDLGMTVVTDGALYVQGDYNTGATYSPDLPGQQNVLLSAPGSNNGLATQNSVTNYTPKPAAVIGDAVMILSNDWNDLNAHTGLGARVAAPTTFNSALLSGSVLTTTGAASGGAHNFPRFLENWSGKDFTYWGSMVELYTSQKWTGRYSAQAGDNIYGAPNRRWNFDDQFRTNPPPGSNLASVYYSRGRWVRY